jgi:hypothetical protein
MGTGDGQLMTLQSLDSDGHPVEQTARTSRAYVKLLNSLTLLFSKNMKKINLKNQGAHQ